MNLILLLSYLAAVGFCQPVIHDDWGIRKNGVSQGTVWNLASEKILQREEMARILGIAKERSARTYTFLVTCANTALRLSEVGHIRADDVLPRCQLRVTRRKKKVLQATVIDISPHLAAILDEWKQMFDGYLWPGNAAPCIIHRSKKGVRLPDEQVCNGGHISLRVIQRDWALFVAEAGLRMHGRGIHSTRHFGITEFYDKHRDLRAAQVFAGHSSSQMTEKYAAVREMKEKVNAMEAMV
jgi:integrase